MLQYGRVHSGLVPSCGDWGRDAKVGFTEDLVTCPACRTLWIEQGMPKFLVRSGETNAEFLTRTRAS